jgi:hypothetical protein
MEAIEQAIERRVLESACHWFPDRVKPATVRLRQLSSRPRSLLYAVHLDDHGSPQVLAKVRRRQPGAGDEAGPGARPRLAADPLGDDELTALEYSGLRDIFATFGTSDASFRAIRPLDHLEAENTILMEYLDACTLRQTLLAQSRLPPRRRPAADPLGGRMWWLAGSWLRTFQRSLPHEDLAPRQQRRVDVVERFGAYDEFLTGRLGARSFGDLARRGAELAAAVLPERLPMAVGHGDYAPRNVFTGPDGRLTVFDPMPRWAVPCYEDLCRFLVGMRLVGLQIHTHGLAYARPDLERREQEVISGYFGADEVPLAPLRAYQLLIMLDKWSALVDSDQRGWRPRLRTSSVEIASGYLRTEARRLLSAGVGALG